MTEEKKSASKEEEIRGDAGASSLPKLLSFEAPSGSGPGESDPSREGGAPGSPLAAARAEKPKAPVLPFVGVSYEEKRDRIRRILKIERGRVRAYLLRTRSGPAIRGGGPEKP